VPEIRDAEQGQLEACVELWVQACAVRDGHRATGVAERERTKFANSAAWLVSERNAQINGFALATLPGSGSPNDPAHAAVLGLLAVDPAAQGGGLGRRLLRAITTELANHGYQEAVLHVLTDNTGAVRLYESEGWQRHGEPFDHTLLHRPSQSYIRQF